MNVRSKMSPGYTPGRGDKGAELWFNVVSENNDELKSISENAIYGKSTPSGSFEIFGEFPVEKFQYIQGQNVEEFYVDLRELDDGAGAKDRIFSCRARKAYQSAASVNHVKEAITNFRYIITEPNLGGSYKISCANPSASAWMIEHDEVLITVSPALGRKSDREIELLQKIYVDQVASVLGYNKFETAAEAREKLIGWTVSCRFRVWRALGERGEMTREWDVHNVIDAAISKITFKTPAA